MRADVRAGLGVCTTAVGTVAACVALAAQDGQWLTYSGSYRGTVVSLWHWILLSSTPAR